ncbi:hypothetical protein NBRC116493_24520 [Aurantivibrio infirmus]
MSLSDLNINFMGRRKIVGALSIAFVVISLIELAINGLNLGMDFTGGTQIKLGYETTADIQQIRDVLEEQALRDAVVVYFGAETEILIRFQGSLESVAVERITERLAAIDPEAEILSVTQGGNEHAATVTVSSNEDLSSKITDIFPADFFVDTTVRKERNGDTVFMLENALDLWVSESVNAELSAAAGSTVEWKGSDFVDSQVGSEMFENAVIGLLVALGIVMLYVALRFQFKFSVGAVAALAHDVIVVLGFFALFNLDFDLTVFAAVLAVIGYSLNDTIVVSDRIRENFRKMRKGSSVEIINASLNQTLGRTLMTSLTTLIVLFALFFFGGEVIHGFALALLIGVTAGTYSSIYVAANVMLVMKVDKEDLMVPVKEGAELDELP